MAFLLIGRRLDQWSLPYMYRDDAVNVLMIAQMGIERGWPTGSDRLGAPGTLDLAYYPMCEYGQLLLIRLLGVFGLNAVETINAYFLATFALCAAIAFVVLQRLGLAAALSALGALVFSLLPYHFWRGTEHMFVSGYFWVPLLCYVVLRLDALQSRRQRRWVIAVCFVAPLINVYYSFFFGFLLVTHAALDAYHRRSWWPAVQARHGLIALIVGVIAGVARSLPLYIHEGLAFKRSPRDIEFYGLKITQMIMPAFLALSSHVRQAVEEYAKTAPLVTENNTNDLGLLGGCAFLCAFTLAFALAHRDTEASSTDELIARSGWCVLLCVLFSTVGGFSAIFAYVVSAFIRSVNRIEVFIAFFALVSTLLFVQSRVLQRLAPRYEPIAMTFACTMAVGVLAWDTAQRSIAPAFEQTDAAYAQDAAYFAQLEAALPQGAHIYQLPYVLYPEGGRSEAEYAPFRPYLHTRQLVWSFGAVRGSEAEKSNQQAEALLLGGDFGTFRALLKAQGFVGVLLSRELAVQDRLPHEVLLNTALGLPILDGAQDTFVYYPL